MRDIIYDEVHDTVHRRVPNPEQPCRFCHELSERIYTRLTAHFGGVLGALEQV